MIIALVDGLIIQWIIDPSRLPGSVEVVRALDETFALLAPGQSVPESGLLGGTQDAQCAGLREKQRTLDSG